MDIKQIQKEASVQSEQYAQECTEVAQLISDTPLRTHNELQTFVAWVSEIKQQYKQIEEQKKKFTDGLKKVLSDLNEFFDSPLRSLKLAETSAKEKINIFLAQTLEERDKLLNQAAHATKTEAKTLIEKADRLNPPKIKGLSTREQWTCSIEDEKTLFDFLIDRCLHMFLKIDEQALKEHVKTLKEDPKYPGLKAEIKKTIAIGKV